MPALPDFIFSVYWSASFFILIHIFLFSFSLSILLMPQLPRISLCSVLSLVSQLHHLSWAVTPVVAETIAHTLGFPRKAEVMREVWWQQRRGRRRASDRRRKRVQHLEGPHPTALWLPLSWAAVEVGPEARRPQDGHRSQTCKQFATDFQELGGLGS